MFIPNSLDIDEIFEDLSKIIGKENVISDLSTRIIYAQDPMPYELEEHNIPILVVRPACAEEVSKILRYANEKNIPVHVRGAGTSLVGVARPKTNAILIDLKRMSNIKVYPDRGYFEAGPGARLWKVREELAKYNSILPAFPGSERVATLGGVISSNTSAHAVDAALGKPGDFVLGLEIVLPTGEIIETGTESTRRPAGIELTKLFIGGEGLFGIITKIRMRLVPGIYVKNLVAYYKDVDTILSTVVDMYRNMVPPPLFFEFVDENAAKVGFEAVGLDEPPGPVVMITMHDWVEEGVNEKAKIFLNFLKSKDIIKAKIVEDEDEWRKIWRSRSEVGNFLNRKGVVAGSEISPRIDKLKDAYYEAKDLKNKLEAYKTPQFFSFGHIGAPTIHANYLIPFEVSNDVRKKFVIEVRMKTEEINIKYGGCGGEWGLTAQRIDFIKKKYGKVYYETLKKIKAVLDPNNILNRGNLEGWW